MKPCARTRNKYSMSILSFHKDNIYSSLKCVEQLYIFIYTSRSQDLYTQLKLESQSRQEIPNDKRAKIIGTRTTTTMHWQLQVPHTFQTQMVTYIILCFSYKMYNSNLNRHHINISPSLRHLKKPLGFLHQFPKPDFEASPLLSRVL